MRIGNQNLQTYTVRIDSRCGEAILYAATELCRYIKKYAGVTLPIATAASPTEHAIVLTAADGANDGFRIRYADGDLYMEGGNGRSVLYAVYAFIERFLGVRFFAPPAAYRGLEFGAFAEGVETAVTAPTDVPSNFCLEEHSPIGYRDAYTYVYNQPDWCAKQKINAQSWGLRIFGSELGGGLRYADDGGHTFGKLIPVATYGETHPEYFSMRDGARVVDRETQLCMTNDELVEPIETELRRLLALMPDARLVSVSQNDNTEFCACEKCRRSYEKYGKFGTLLRFVNKIAARLEKDFPDVLVHTFAYWGTDDVNTSVKARKNVAVQFCPTKQCRCHALNDPHCAINRKIYANLKTLSEICDNVFIYDYRGCLKYAMLLLPDLDTWRETAQAYAACNVKGIYSEMSIFTLNQPTFEELRAYLFGKLMWDPYMEQTEFDRHVNEFLAGYYGTGWRHLRDFLDRWNAEAKDKHMTGFLGAMADETLQYEKRDGAYVFAELIAPEKLAAFCKWGNEQFDLAVSYADDAQRERIECARTSLLWYELFHTMERILETGTQDEKAAVIARNRDLCSRMRKYCMKYTIYIGMNATTRMYDDFSLPPSEWNYTGSIAGDSLDL
ncbi:MAG: DUF4838 domain-containing protein [Clostridia bacterium]|jgi:hypothetical protein|nr:DUF4838 domain-containing protein [Clostridia bacterium]